MEPQTRRSFVKTLTLSGLTFSGIRGFGCSESGEKELSGKKQMKHWDVIVSGGGPGGIPAAITAARNGARVLLIERYGFLGGMATAGLVEPFMPYHAGETVLSRGTFTGLLNSLEKEGAILPDRIHFDAEPMKWVLEKMVLDAGADMLLHADVTGVLKENGTIRALRIFHKGGVEDLSADLFIDSTGDGDIAAWSGAPFEIGRQEDNACQPMTLNFRMANVKTSDIPPAREINRLYDQAKERGEIENPRENVLSFRSVHPDVIHFNTTRIIGKTPLDGWSMTEAEIEARKQTARMVAFLKKHIRGFEDAYLMKMAPQTGVRESRRILGKYILTADDVLSARKFTDSIACSSYNIDIHNPTGTGTVHKRLEPGTYYTIPYRCLLPGKVNNLLVASRCISATHEAHSSLRIMPVVWCLGDAAGTATGLCIRNRIKPGELRADILREQLRKQGSFIV